MADDDSKALQLSARNLSHRFGRRRVITDVSFECKLGDAVCITGHNGSGKSTLLRILTGLIVPGKGEVELSRNGEVLGKESRRNALCLVSPEINMYESLTGFENLELITKLSGIEVDGDDLDSALEQVGLEGRGHDFYGEYSSGMKQRLKIASAIISNPEVLLLDEPTANLDDAGKERIYHIMHDFQAHGILIFATNEKQEVRFGGQVIGLD